MNQFLNDLNQLNQQQKEAVYCIDKNALILAPAGTGKTKVIALRTAHLLEQGIEPEKILNLTFTNKAAKEMESRIQLYAPSATKSLTIKTFHSFCYHLLNQEKQNTHFSFPCTIIDESDTKEILERILNALTKKSGTQESVNVDYAILHFIENVKKHSLTFPLEERTKYEIIVSDYIKQFHVRDTLIKNYGLRMLKMYQKYLRVNNSLDFIDLIIEATNLMEDPNIQKKWNAQFKYIQVDEMQDTSSREYALIKKLAKDNNITLYGDFNQTIYEWRGSMPMRMIEDFNQSFAPIQIDLTTNYRSTQMLLNAANQYIRNSKLYPLDCVCHSPIEGEPIEVLITADEPKELRAIAQSIQMHLEQGESSIAVLTRLNNQAKAMSEVCEKQGIPTLRVEDIRLFRKKEVKDIQAFFNYALNPRNSHALERVLKLPLFKIEEWLLIELKKTQKDYMYLHDWFLAEHNDPYNHLLKAYRDNDLIVLDVESTGLDTTTDDIIQIAAIRYGQDGVISQLDILVKPTKSVGASYHVHGFTDEKLEAEGLVPEEALDQLLQFIKSYTLVGHNIHYDLSIIESMLSRYNKRPLNNHFVYDTLDLACKIYPHLPNHKLETLSKHIQTQAKPNHNALQDILATGEVLSHFIKKLQEKQGERLEALEAYYPYIEQYKVTLQSLVDEILTESSENSIEYLLKECQLIEYYSQEEQENLLTYKDMAKQLSSEEKSIKDNLTKLLSFAALHTSEVEQSELFKDKIPIMTIHQAKGLEFNIVYIIGCNDGIFPLRRSEKDGLIAEEHRLFYVGMTRPKEKLYISYNNRKKMSPFIEEIGEDYKIYRQIQ